MEKFCYLGSLVTEDGRSLEVVMKRRIALGKEAFSKKRDLMTKSEETYGKSIYLEYCVVWK